MNSNTSTLTDTLNRISNWLENNMSGYTRFLKPGLQKNRIIALTSDLPFKLPEEIFRLYQWRNGTNQSLKTIIAYPPQFLPLEEAIEIVRQYILPNEIRYRGKLIFPFLGGGVGYCGVLVGRKACPSSAVVYFHPEDKPKIAFTNVTSMMSSLAECFETGAFFLEDEFIRENKVAAATICRTHNPEVMSELIQLLSQLLERPTELTESENSSLLELLIVFRKYQNPEIVESLMEALGVLQAASSEQIYLLRIWIVETLGEIVDARIAPFLIRLLQSETDWAVRCNIAVALGHLGDKLAIASLSQMITSPQDQGQPRSKALHSLYQLGAVDELAQFVQHPDAEIQAAAIRYLGYLEVTQK